MSEYRYRTYDELYPERNEYDGGDYLDSEYGLETARYVLDRKIYPGLTAGEDKFISFYLWYVDIAIHEAYADDYIAYHNSSTPPYSLTRQLNAWYFNAFLEFAINMQPTIANYIKQYGEKPVQTSVEKVTRSMNKNLKDTGTSSNKRKYETSGNDTVTLKHGKVVKTDATDTYDNTSDTQTNLLPQQENPTTFTGFDYMNKFDRDTDNSSSIKKGEISATGEDKTSNVKENTTNGTEDFTRDYLKTDDTTESKEKVNENQVESIPEVVDNLVRLLERVCHNCIAEFGRTWIKYPPRDDIIEAILYER